MTSMARFDGISVPWDFMHRTVPSLHCRLNAEAVKGDAAMASSTPMAKIAWFECRQKDWVCML